MSRPIASRLVIAWVLGGLISTAAATEVIISELMYNPAPGKPEYIELQNLTANPLDIAGWTFTAGIDYAFADFSDANPMISFLKPFERILLSDVAEATLRAAYPSIPLATRIYGPYLGALNDDGEQVSLEDKNGVGVTTVTYDDNRFWPAGPDGTGHSLSVINSNKVIDDDRNWRTSYAQGGSPGSAPGAPTANHDKLQFSELEFSSSNTVAWVELYNTAPASVFMNGLSIAAGTSLTNKVALSSFIAGSGYASLDVNLPLDGGDAVLFLIDSNDVVLDAIDLDPHATRAFAQTFPAGSDEWYSSSTGTRDAANNPDRTTAIVINELMIDPASQERDGEYIELYNNSGAPVNLGGWELDSAVRFTFPLNTMLPAGGYLVVAANLDYFTSTYGGGITAFGPYNGQLGNDGELLRLVDAEGNLADGLYYGVEGDWPWLAHGLGSSLELVHPNMDNRLASSWRDSVESNKTTMSSFSVSGTWQNLNARGDATDYKELHFFLVGDSHIVLDNVELRKDGTGPDLLEDKSQLASSADDPHGWLRQGTHQATYLDTGGALHVVSDGHGDNKANRVEIDVTGVQPNDSLTLTFDARWVYGKPRLVAQTWDHSVGGTFLLPIPNNLGTPGAANSAFQTATPPNVEQLSHSPAVPKTSENVRVTAWVDSVAPLSTVLLFHRADNINGNGTWANQAMFDDGVNGGDTIAGDGQYSTLVTTHKVDKRIVQFYVEATANNGKERLLPQTGPERPAMWIVDNQAVAGTLRTMRFIISEYDRDALNAPTGRGPKYDYRFPLMSNHHFNMTLIAGEKDIFYNGEMRKSGSPFTRVGGNSLDRGKFKLPQDRLFRGRKKFMFDSDATDNGRKEKNRVSRYLLYQLGQAVNESEMCLYMINGGPLVIKEEVEAVGQDLIERNFKDTGELMRTDDQWWFEDNESRGAASATWDYKNTDETIRYHSEWNSRSHETAYDYSALISWFETVDGNAFNEQQINRLADPELMNLHAAVRGYSMDWDSIVIDRGKNGYMYRKAEDGRWMFLHWDSDLAYQSNRIGDRFYGGLAGLRNYFGKPYNKRLFDYYLLYIVDHLSKNSARMTTWLNLEATASTHYDPGIGVFTSWFTGREAPSLNEIGTAALNQAFVVNTGDGSSLITTNSVLTLAGNAGATAFTVEVVGHPETQTVWPGKVDWEISGLRLGQGVHELVLNTLDHNGVAVDTHLFTVTKTGNAVPVADLEINPGSWNVPITGALVIGSGDSYDPEGTLLSYTFSASGPGLITTNLNNNSDEVTFAFSLPGLYEITVTLTDADSQQTVYTREAAVYNVNGFSSFSDDFLDSIWSLQNVELEDNYSLDSYYSLHARSGFLSVHLNEKPARPFTFFSPTYPMLYRSLSETNDWVMQTRLQMETRQFGNYLTGLLAEIVEGGDTNRYAFGMKDGSTLQVVQQLSSGLETVLAAASVVENSNTLRIHRAGNQLRFERRNDDDTWTLVHTKSLTPGTTSLQGGVFASTESAQSIRTAFDYVMTIDISTTPSIYEGLRISEIMYDPPGGDTYEYLELIHLGVGSIDLAGVKFVATQPFDELILASRIMNPGDRVLIVNDSAAMQARYGAGILPSIAGEWAEGKLSNNGERITLVDPSDHIILSFVYGVNGRWPLRAADEGGSSIEIVDPFADLEDPANWTASHPYQGTPGSGSSGPAQPVVINEILTHTDSPAVDAVELYNTSASPVNIGDWYLSDKAGDYQKFKIPANTMIGGFGYITFDETQFNPNGDWNPSPGVPAAWEFGLGSKGDELYLIEADASTNLVSFIDQVEFDAAQNGVSFGRYLNSIGAEYMPPQTNLTFGSTNAGPRIGPVVISEIMYFPTAGNMEYIELQNISDTAVPLFHPVHTTNTWAITGIGFSFPENVTLNPKEVALIASGDPLSFRSQNNVPADVRIFGPFNGLLQNDGENIRLRKPDTPDIAENVAPYITVDEVRYEVTTPWSVEANGAGPALERLDVTAFANDPANWGATTGTGTPGETTLPATTPLIRLSNFQVDVPSVEFSDAADTSIQIWNNGLGTLNFSIADDQPWLSVSPASGSSTGTNDLQTLVLSFDTASMVAGQYVAQFTVTDPAALNSPLTIPVILTVNEPSIAASPTAIIHTAHVGFDATPVDFLIWNEDEQGTLLDYTISDNAGWLSVLPASESSAGPFEARTHTLHFDTDGLPLGQLMGQVFIDDTLNSAPNDGYSLPITVEIVQMDVVALVATNFGLGRATLNGVFSNSVIGADVWVFYGVEDGGSNSNAWENAAFVGHLADGEIHHTVNDIFFGFGYTYRFMVRNAYDEIWSNAAEEFMTTPPSGAFAPSLIVKTYDTVNGDNFLAPIQNLLDQTPSGTATWTDPSLNYPDYAALSAIIPGSLTAEENYSLSWEGVMIIGPDDLGAWTLGTRSDDGSAWYVDLNRDGDFADPGELIVSNLGAHGCGDVVGGVTFTEPGCYPIVFGMYENGGGECMEAKFAKGAGLAYAALTFLDGSPGSGQPFTSACPAPDVAVVATLPATDKGFEAAMAHANYEGAGMAYQLNVFYGTTAGGTNVNAWQKSEYVGTFANLVDPDISFLIDRLQPSTLYFYTFQAFNDVSTVWATGTQIIVTTAGPGFTVEISALDALSSSDIVILSTGQAGWPVVVDYTTDELAENENITWQPLNVLNNSFANGVNTTTVSPPPVWQRFYVRVRNLQP